MVISYELPNHLRRSRSFRTFYALDGLSKTTSALLDAGGKKGKAKAQEPAESQNDNATDQKGAQIKVYLDFKRYIYDEKKRMIQ